VQNGAGLNILFRVGNFSVTSTPFFRGFPPSDPVSARGLCFLVGDTFAAEFAATVQKVVLLLLPPAENSLFPRAGHLL
jgi:hypothetical protein